MVWITIKRMVGNDKVITVWEKWYQTFPPAQHILSTEVTSSVTTTTTTATANVRYLSNEMCWKRLNIMLHMPVMRSFCKRPQSKHTHTHTYTGKNNSIQLNVTFAHSAYPRSNGKRIHRKCYLFECLFSKSVRLAIGAGATQHTLNKQFTVARECRASHLPAFGLMLPIERIRIQSILRVWIITIGARCAIDYYLSSGTMGALDA